MHKGGPTRFVGEPIWLGRTGPEVAEAIRYEALVSEVAGNSVNQLCDLVQMRSGANGTCVRLTMTD